MADAKLLLQKTIGHLERGLESQRLGRFREARLSLLKAAEYLFRAAEESRSPLKELRIQRAEMLVERARELNSSMSACEQACGNQASDADAAKAWLVSDRPSTRLDDVSGLEEVKLQIRIKMVYPYTHPELAQKYGVKRGGGILLYGPPGTGKTMLARAVAGEIDGSFYSVKPSEIMSKWVGEAERNVANLFAAARRHARAVVFIDEVEALAPRRCDSHSTVMQRVVPQILAELDGFSLHKEGNVLLFMGATNEPWSLDEAMMRPGRLDERLYVPLPDLASRCQMLRANLRGKPLAPGLKLDEIANLCDGYSGADLRRICEKACDIPFVESIYTGRQRNIEAGDIMRALDSVKPSVSPRVITRFREFAREGRH